MGHTQEEKSQNHERILREASRAVRGQGLESLTVSELMDRVGLTHGGFYRHFDSRSALVNTALKRALVDGASRATLTNAENKADLTSLIEGYLSENHRSGRAGGCAIAALNSDVARSSRDNRDSMTPHIDAFIDSVSEMLNGDRDKAALVVSALVGALSLSRVYTDETQASQLLEAVRDSILGMHSSSLAQREDT